MNDHKSLKKLFPEIAAEWHPTKNGEKTPDDVSYGSEQKVWWRCDKGHEWFASVGHRTSGEKCPYCKNKKVLQGYNDLATLYPEISAEFHPHKNGSLSPQNILAGSNKKVWWRCRYGHEWEECISKRTKRGFGCPYDSGQRLLEGFNDLATTDPDIAAEWHTTKNGELQPNMVMRKTNKKVWWRCEKGHSWKSMIYSRTSGNDCPYCENREILVGDNDLGTTHPALAKEFHPTKNGELTVQQLVAGSNKKVWWQCKEGHEWSASVVSRVAGNNCPYCSNQKVWVGYNDLVTTHPDIAKEWHPDRNGDLLPTMVVYGSTRKVWWQCDNGHSWQAGINSRANRSGCPECQKGYKTSFPEKAILYYFKKIFPDTIANANNEQLPWLEKMELDIFVPSLMLAVEYDGPRHTRERDRKKNVACKNNGVTLVRVRDMGVQHTLNDSVNFQCVDRSECALEGVLKEVFDFVAGQYDVSIVVDIDIERDSLEIIKLLDLQPKERTLKSMYPEITDEWNYEKNGELNPEQFTFGSNKKVWWKCSVCGHEWKTKICHRTSSGSGCPLCCKRGKVSKDREEQK